MQKLRLVVVGPGLIGKEHIRLINESQDCELVAIVAPDHEQNSIVAAKNNVPMFVDLRTCIEDVRVDGVIVSSPNEFHATQARTCVEANIPVLVEKPITASVSDGEALVELASSRDAIVLVGHHRAHSPLLARAREVIREGSLGRIVSIVGSAQFYKPSAYFEAGPWRTRPGGGPILINLIHEIGNLRSLCGEIVAVSALSSNAVRGYPVEDTVAISLMFASGALGTFLLSDTAVSTMSWEQTSRENPSFPTYPNQDCYFIAGTKGSLSFPTFRLTLGEEGSEPSWWVPFSQVQLSVDREEPLRCQLANFVDCIRRIGSPLVSANDGLQNLRVTEAIARSAFEKRTIYT
jgi:predicted dehydrogenase